MKTVFWKKYLHSQKLLNTPKRMCIPMNFRTFAAVSPSYGSLSLWTLQLSASSADDGALCHDDGGGLGVQHR